MRPWSLIYRHLFCLPAQWKLQEYRKLVSALPAFGWLPEAEPELVISVHVVYVWDEPRKHQLGSGDVRKHVFVKSVAMVQLECNSLGVPTLSLRYLVPLYTEVHQSLRRAAPGRRSILRNPGQIGRWVGGCGWGICSTPWHLMVGVLDSLGTRFQDGSWSSCSCIVLSFTGSGLVLPGRSDDLWLPRLGLSWCLGSVALQELAAMSWGTHMDRSWGPWPTASTNLLAKWATLKIHPLRLPWWSSG